MMNANEEWKLFYMCMGNEFNDKVIVFIFCML